MPRRKRTKRKTLASSDRPDGKRELLLFVRPLVQVTNVILDIRNELASSSLPAIVANDCVNVNHSESAVADHAPCRSFWKAAAAAASL